MLTSSPPSPKKELVECGILPFSDLYIKIFSQVFGVSDTPLKAP